MRRRYVVKVLLGARLLYVQQDGVGLVTSREHALKFTSKGAAFVERRKWRGSGAKVLSYRVRPVQRLSAAAETLAA